MFQLIVKRYYTSPIKRYFLRWGDSIVEVSDRISEIKYNQGDILMADFSIDYNDFRDILVLISIE